MVGSLCSRDFRAFPPGFLAGQRSGAGFFLLSSVPRRARSRTAPVVAGPLGPKRVAPFPLPATVDTFSDFFPDGTSVPHCTSTHYDALALISATRSSFFPKDDNLGVLKSIRVQLRV